MIDGLVDYFFKFTDGLNVDADGNTQEQMPVLWHQSLLLLAQKYRDALSDEQKGRLKELMRVRNHPTITESIRKALFSS